MASIWVHLGPDSLEHQWTAPLQKFRDRVAHINAFRGPLSLAALQFNMKALPVLQYVGQLVPPPQKFAVTELASGGKVLGIASNALTADTMYALHKMGGVQLFRPVLVLTACMIRAAVKTLRPSAAMVYELQQVAHEFLPLAFGSAASPIPPGWQGEAICQLLLNAENGIFFLTFCCVNALLSTRPTGRCCALSSGIIDTEIYVRADRVKSTNA